MDRNDRRAQALQAFYRMHWTELLRHAGVEGDRLTKDQYLMASRLTSIDTSRLNVAEGLGHAIFDVIDDNEISEDEYTRFIKDVWKVTTPDAMDSFTMLDTDGDGYISRLEFIRALREYFYSTDPGAAGSMIFGRL
jgi:Ca2+-binding EF-hand superfamily protein